MYSSTNEPAVRSSPLSLATVKRCTSWPMVTEQVDEQSRAVLSPLIISASKYVEGANEDSDDHCTL
jgi:hypothetical protein